MRQVNRDTLPHLLHSALSLVRASCGTWLSRLSAWWWGVDLQPGCRFYGIPVFRRHPASSIRIAEGSRFRSARWSSRLGLNRSCMISTLKERAMVTIGSSCGLSGTVIAAAEKIVIGDRVMCGANVTITDTDWHPVEKGARQIGAAPESAPVTIGDDVWLGHSVLVLKGVTIGAGTVVGANSVVARDLPPDVLATGAPARVVRSLSQDK